MSENSEALKTEKQNKHFYATFGLKTNNTELH